MSFKLSIVTPKGLYEELDVDSLTIKLTTGYRTFLSGHAPLIGAIDIGTMHIVKNGKTIYYAIHGGAINVENDKTVILTNAIEKSNEIDIKRANKSLERAKNRLDEKDINLDVKRAELAIKRAMVRLETSKL
ncbi:MAG TPA: ATP synthase F1 subunit epsilon [Firmicutes bacterium]|nr:ATP synthase F1 subunit epsilon [Bacillota bacterium]